MSDTVQALYVDTKPDAIYPHLLGAERCWGVDRDARLYQGPDPVVAHPPCQLWVNFAAQNWQRGKNEGRLRPYPAWYPGGGDGGLFACAVESLRAHGGVLEHPANSHAWATFGIPHPTAGRGWLKAYDARTNPWTDWGWVCEVWQSAYGHKARKRTWLVYCSPANRPPFDLDWTRKPGTHQVGWFDRVKPSLGKRAASATPRRFAETLIRLADWSRGA